MKTTLVILTAALALALAGCAPARTVTFPHGTTMDRLHEAGVVRVGVKSDQPSLGFRNPATNRYEGFDVEIAKIIAQELGLTSGQVQYVETPSAVRERYLQQGRVDIIVASYSMNEHRQASVGQAGPYFVTGQQLLVRRSDRNVITGPDKVPAHRVCSAEGSTSIDNWRIRYGAVPVAELTYTRCVQRLLAHSVDAVTTDGAVLLGYVAQLPTRLSVVGEPFSLDAYGIGYPKGDNEFCAFLTHAIADASHDGRWDKAFDNTLGRADVPAPPKPPLQPCRS